VLGKLEQHQLVSSPENYRFREGLCFAGIYFFFSLCNLRALSANCCEILHVTWKCVQFYNLCLKFWRGLFQKNLGAKNMQNLAWFWMTSKFGGEYLRNG